ncbi:outer membrane protein [Geotalea uraniireducens]|uniref:Outer membrane protein n=1 Tax=Geotalea uraniireducens TaxID=351604 RepID=A0ABN6VM10_9BACT|nr:OmpW family outer membrane protein [Geotalea uraniireducens]BDV41178.1 outer membrane protein [Geotalea uraniireducens]
MTKAMGVIGALLLLALTGTTALADSIKGRLGVTGRIGFYLPTDSDYNDYKLETDAGFLGGGGLIYGITDNLAAEIEVTHTEFGANRVSDADEGDFEIVNVALGAQYRFLIPQPVLVPYAGGGLDILINDYKRPNGTNVDVDTTVGAHICGGIDYFLTKQLVLNAEMRAVIAPQVDINGPDGSGHFDPSGFAGTFGFRVFFN